MAGLTTISGQNIMKMFDNLLNTKTESEFNSACNMMVTVWGQLVPGWTPPTDSPGWLKFCEDFPKAAQSHCTGHPSIMEDDVNCLPLIHKIYSSHKIPQTKEHIIENASVLIPNSSVTFSTPKVNISWTQEEPHNNRVEYTIETLVEKPQAADQFSLDETFLVMRHTCGTKKALGLVTNSPSTLVTKTIKVSLWLTNNGDGTYTYYCPGTACYTGQSIGTNFNPWAAFPNYVNEINEVYQEFTPEQKKIKYEKLYRQLGVFTETVKNDKKMYALSLLAV